MAGETNGWNEWSKHVLKELERLTQSSEAMQKELQEFKVDITREIAKKSEVEEIKDELTSHKLARIEDLSALKENIVKTMTEIQKDHNKELADLNRNHSVSIAVLKSDLKNKAGTWGAMAGAIPASIAMLMVLVKTFLAG
jgi:chromosome segregation ATPase|tara:strand:- start:1513 stop:1932 length:420 start_codon:yes stop_codon:yes gene_type:complete